MTDKTNFSLITICVFGILLGLTFPILLGCTHQRINSGESSDEVADSTCFANLRGTQWVQTYDSEWREAGGDTLRLELGQDSALFSIKKSGWTCPCVYHYNEGISYLFFPCDKNERIKYVVKECCEEELKVEVWVSNKENGKFRKVGRKVFRRMRS